MSSCTSQKGLVWFRRDLRLSDNTAVIEALKRCDEVFSVFVFDTSILRDLARNDQRVRFIWYSVVELREKIRALGGELYIRHGDPILELQQIISDLTIHSLYFSRDYEPYAVDRDLRVEQTLLSIGKKVYSFKDQVIMERDDVMTAQGTPYTVFTPYKKAWLKKVNEKGISLDPDSNVPWKKMSKAYLQSMPTLSDMGFSDEVSNNSDFSPGESGAQKILGRFLKKIEHYDSDRNYPSLRATSHLSVHLRFGTISIRDLYRFATSSQTPGRKAWLDELIWRDFYFNIIHHFPFVVDMAFRPAYRELKFENKEDYFEAWCQGQTGYPIVDAGMRQLNSCGFMHNRLRMITASFLVKDLQIDWRWGEKYFASKLMDYDLSANNGGWQWAASTGCDAQPYFRIFNPTLQSKRFDKAGTFIRCYLPELRGLSDSCIHEPWLMHRREQKQFLCEIGKDYPAPLVNHSERRDSTIAMFKKARNAHTVN